MHLVSSRFLWQLTLLLGLLLQRRVDAYDAFDFIIVGGGTAGLVLANRLSSNRNISVAVVEAGNLVFNNTNITQVERYGAALGSAVDWSYSSIPQKYTGNRSLIYSAGKALGGTSTINGMTYLRSDISQIDLWERLGNPGWNWEKLWPHYLKSEAFQSPTDVQEEKGATFERCAHSRDGHVAVGWSKYLIGQNASSVFRETSEALNYPFNADANDGSMRGFSTWPRTLNASDSIRADAARSYYYPIAASRPNLALYLNTTATRVIWSTTRSKAPKIAQGVQMLAADNSLKTLYAGREVILSAGSIRSPALLELSGVGNPEILEALGIETVVSLPSVGSNLQDQANSVIYYSSTKNWTGYPSFVTYLTSSDLFGSELQTITNSVLANISAYAETIVADTHPGSSNASKSLQNLLRSQAKLIFNPNSTVPLAEILWAPSQTAIVAAFWNLLPFSRGSIHIKSADSTKAPIIDTNFFQLPIDEYVQAAAAVQVRRHFTTAPLSALVTSEVTPNFTTVPEKAGWNDNSWSEWAKKAYTSNQHPISTCAMMDKDLGGVVDNEGKVYGTKNVRVVDASIIPMQVSGHLSATVYALAEKIAADIMRGDSKKD